MDGKREAGRQSNRAAPQFAHRLPPRWAHAADSLLRYVLALTKWLVLPIGLMLFLQWPLRSYVQAGSREANDLGQILFAIYIAASVAAATRAGTHLTAGGIATGYRPATQRAIRILGTIGAVLPWLIFIAWSATPMIVNAATNMERFQDSLNPGYFIVKLALWLLAITLMVASLLDCARSPSEGHRHPANTPDADGWTSSGTMTSRTERDFSP
jgi:TRAP-type C4-dicarboxylate transport system permease small subunit